MPCATVENVVSSYLGDADLAPSSSRQTQDRQQERRPGSLASSSALMHRLADNTGQAARVGARFLHTKLGAVLDDRATKMFVGTAIAGVIEEHGFEPVSTGERIPANVAGFRTGAHYVRSAADQVEQITNDTEVTDDILLTMLAALSDTQRRRLVQMIKNSAA